MGSKLLKDFVTKIQEAEDIFVRLCMNDQTAALSVILSMLQRCKVVNLNQEQDPGTKDSTPVIYSIDEDKAASVKMLGKSCTKENITCHREDQSTAGETSFLNENDKPVLNQVTRKAKSFDKKNSQYTQHNEKCDFHEDKLVFKTVPGIPQSDSCFTEKGTRNAKRKRKQLHPVKYPLEVKIVQPELGNYKNLSCNVLCGKKSKTPITSREETDNGQRSGSFSSVTEIPQNDQKKPIKLLIKNSYKRRNKSHYHIRQREKRPLFSCSSCGVEYTHQQSYLSHFMEYHTADPCSCKYCHQVFLFSDSFILHKCNNKMFKTCGEESRKLFDLKEHTKLTHSKQFNCKFCGKCFAQKRSMFLHYVSHAKGKFVCVRCGEISETKVDYDNHKKTHDVKFACTVCKKIFRSSSKCDAHIKRHDSLQCYVCDELFLSPELLNAHLKQIHNQKPVKEMKFECEVCLKLFLRRSMLQTHRRIHTGEKPFECTACQLYFRTRKALSFHKQTMTHSFKAGEKLKERRHLCSECGKAYLRKHALMRHMKIHSGQKPHMCQYCGYKCQESGNLKRHMLLHFEAERNFVCEVCGAAFHAKKTLETHHAYKHSDLKPFECEQCELAFKTKNALKRHSSTHSDKKEHKCWCGSGFSRMYNLRRHLKSVHGTDDLLPPIRRVQTLDKSKKAPISRTDLIEEERPINDRNPLSLGNNENNVNTVNVQIVPSGDPPIPQYDMFSVRLSSVSDINSVPRSTSNYHNLTADQGQINNISIVSVNSEQLCHVQNFQPSELQKVGCFSNGSRNSIQNTPRQSDGQLHSTFSSSILNPVTPQI